MIYIIAMLGLILALISIFVFAKPALALGFVRTYFTTRKFQYGTALASLLLAAAFYYGAADTRFPQVFEYFAMFSIVGAAFCLCLFPAQFRKIVVWELDLISPFPAFLAAWYAFFALFIFYAIS